MAERDDGVVDGAADGAVAGLAEVIGQVRDELERAQRAGEGRDLKFSVEKVNLEFAVQVRREGSGRAELRIGVLTAGGGGSAARDSTHTIQIELKPQGANGDPNVSISSR